MHQNLLVLLWEHLLSTLSISCCYCNAQCFLNLNKWNEKIIWLISKPSNGICGNFEKCWMHFVFKKTLSISGHTVCELWHVLVTTHEIFSLCSGFFLIFKTRNHKYQGQKLNHHGRKILTFIITDFSTNCSLSSCKFNPCYRKTSCNLEKETFTIFF